MGNKHSTEQSKDNIIRSKSLESAHSVIVPSSTLSTPGLSRSSSKTTSRPASVMGDVKDCVNKILGRSSPSLDVTPQPYQTTPRRSFSAPPSCSDSAMLNSSSNLSASATTTKYCFLIDETEQDRLTNTHYVLKHCFGDNFSAPVHDLLSRSISVARVSPNLAPANTALMRDNSSLSSSVVSSVSISSIKDNSWSIPNRVLDVACGSGVWVLEMATDYPHTQFYGIDAVSIFPSCIKPPNTIFQQHDLLDKDGFPYPDEYFDYIHMRLVYNCFSKADLKFVLAEINRVLKPGGYVELRDIDPTIKHPGPITENVFSDFVALMSQLNSVDVSWTSHIGEVLASQGELTDIYDQVVSVGFGLNDPIAASVENSICDAIRSYKSFFMEAYKLTSQECDDKINEIIQESEKYSSYFNYYMAWGRKPLFIKETLVSNDYKMSLAHAILDREMSIQRTTTPVMPFTSASMTSLSLATTASDCRTATTTVSTANEAELLMENAFDIVHLTNGFIE